MTLAGDMLSHTLFKIYICSEIVITRTGQRRAPPPAPRGATLHVRDHELRQGRHGGVQDGDAQEHPRPGAGGRQEVGSEASRCCIQY